MKTGIVKFFNEAKGFGFIKVDGSSEDIFVHANDLKEKIRENDKVQFDVVEGKKGLNAANVSLVK
ncbi:MAG: cold-shock protein [Bacteroidetes bacterium]|jgi:CspA family cold shock protein|nr:cold-shock protein [Bacteroidota bacterium]